MNGIFQEVDETISAPQETGVVAHPEPVTATEEMISDAEVIHEQKAKAPEFFQRYLNYVEAQGDEGHLSYNQWLSEQLKETVTETPDLTALSFKFNNNPRLAPPLGPRPFPSALYPADHVFIGVGNREKRYEEQLSRMLNGDNYVDAQILSMVAMRKYFYTSLAFKLTKKLPRHIKFDFLAVLDRFVTKHIEILLNIAEQTYAAEFAYIHQAQAQAAKQILDKQEEIANQEKAA